MEKYYTIETNVQILISLLKQYGIKRIVASPGTANMSFVASMQNDGYFEIYSSIDERSAAYMACGIAAETGEPVVITCTEATASRNYMPGLTEAYYRKLPILAVMTSHGENLVGSYEPQVIDNRIIPSDIATYNVKLQICKDKSDERNVEVHANEAINRLFMNGGGPVRILLESINPHDYSAKVLPCANVIRFIAKESDLPEMPKGEVAVFIGSHRKWSREEVSSIESFCESNNASVLCDLTSNYFGKYRVNYSLVTTQEGYKEIVKPPKVIIYIGTVSGDYYTSGFCRLAKEVWLVCEDCTFRDRFHNLKYVISMNESSFFSHYISESDIQEMSYFKGMQNDYNTFYDSIPELPFSNLWIAKESSKILPAGCEVHAAINNSLRSWNYFNIPDDIVGRCNVGGYGIDGGLSTCIGASLVSPEKLFFCVIGDLAFFYDMNVLGNRHISNNVRILLINNGKGQEFRNYQHPASQFGDDADKYIAAGGHYANKSRSLVKGYAESLGYDYLSAENKEEFYSKYKDFFSSNKKNAPVLFEVFTDSREENEALEIIRKIKPRTVTFADKAKSAMKEIVGETAVSILKDLKKSIK